MKKFLAEFKIFIARGNVMDLAVGVIIGGAFTNITNSLVNDICTPLLSLITGRIDFNSLKIVLGSGEQAASINYGAFLTQLINFLLVALVIFLVVKQLNRFRRKNEAAEGGAAAPAEKTCPFCRSTIAVEATRCPHCTSHLTKD